MTRPKREAAVLRMAPGELAARTERTFLDGYAKLIERGEIEDAANALATLLTQTADAIAKAEEAADAARSVRVALIRVQLSVGMTMEDIGAVHGLSRQRIGQLLRQFPTASS